MAPSFHRLGISLSLHTDIFGYSQQAIIMFFSLFKTKEKPVLIPFDFERNRYPAHTRWPPVFADMTTREQFRLERKFRRRSKLKWARPVWNRNLQMVQWGTTIFIVGYCTLAVDWSGNQAQDKEIAPGYLKNIREWVDNAAGSIWTHTSSKESQAHVSLMKERYKSEEASKKPSIS
jgi:hypothetical protein